MRNVVHSPSEVCAEESNHVNVEKFRTREMSSWSEILYSDGWGCAGERDSSCS